MYKLVVAKNYRMKGIAQILLKKVLAEFKKKDILWIYTHVHKENVASINLLKKFGFNIRDSHYLIDIY